MRAHSKFRKILTPIAPYGPEIRHWDTMIDMYLALKKFLVEPNRKWNRAIAYRVASKKGIGNPQELTLDVILDGLRFCRLQMAEARKHVTPSRAEMLRGILAEAQENDDRRKICDVKSIMNGEKSKRNWSVINVTVDDPRPPSITEIEREENGEIVWYKDEEGVHKVFQEECEFWYNLVRKTPVMKTSLVSLNETEKDDLKMAKD